MNILVFVNSKYIKQLEVMLYSLRLHYKANADIIVYLLNKSLNEQELCAIEKYLYNKCKMQLQVIDVKNDTFWERMPLGNLYFSVEIYYRILAQYLLPDNIERALWLDADIIVNGDISSFYDQEFEDNSMVVCLDNGSDDDQINVFRRLGYAEELPYFNSGVLLLNLPKLRQDYSYEDILEFCEKWKDKLELPDQDILNLLYRDKVKYDEEKRYNYQVIGGVSISRQEDKPFIIHFIGGAKPWFHIGRNSWYYWRIRCKQHHYLECICVHCCNILVRVIKKVMKLLRGRFYRFGS